MGKTSTESKRKYNEKAYDRISLTVKKGMKEVYKARAKQDGMKLNTLINRLLEEYMKKSSD